MNKTVNTRTR